MVGLLPFLFILLEMPVINCYCKWCVITFSNSVTTECQMTPQKSFKPGMQFEDIALKKGTATVHQTRNEANLAVKTEFKI